MAPKRKQSSQEAEAELPSPKKQKTEHKEDQAAAPVNIFADEHRRGMPICHIDIPCKDLDRISQFYAHVFQWQTTDAGMPKYRMFSTKRDKYGVDGGFYETDEEIQQQKGVAQINLHIQVDDIAAMEILVKKHGGEITKPKFLIGEQIGYNCFFKDSEGNVLGMYEAAAKK